MTTSSASSTASSHDDKPVITWERLTADKIKREAHEARRSRRGKPATARKPFVFVTSLDRPNVLRRSARLAHLRSKQDASIGSRAK
ncbi:hypothetical protein DFH06DRAFT_1344906 [Mycena polygramma]|nr:hypothetical protein DFH06DRAFT_1344906 [Mycena polygramma]